MLEEIRKIDECDMEKFGALDSSEKTIAILRDTSWSSLRVEWNAKLKCTFGVQFCEFRPEILCGDTSPYI